VKTVRLLRHAKSDWQTPFTHDHERGLNARGINATKVMAPFINSSFSAETAIFTSSATRTQLTLSYISQQDPHSTLAPNWLVEKALYTFESNTLLNWLRLLDECYQDVCIVGHNPALTELVNELSDEAIVNLPTCGYVVLSCDINKWQELAAGCGKTVSYLTPKLAKKG